MRRRDRPDDRSRRAFLRHVPGWLVAPVLVAGCRRRAPPQEEQGGETPPSEETGAQEEVSGAAEPVAPLPDAEPVVRVRVQRIGGDAEPSVIGAEGRWIEVRGPLGEEAGDAAAGSAATAAPPAPPVMSVLHAPVSVRRTSDGWSVLDARGFRASVPATAVELAPAGPANDALIVLDGRRYPGTLRLVPRGPAAERRYDVVNHVALERYLPGVLVGELFSHWHPNAFAAQAVAARSFACAEHAYRARRHYDLTDTTRSQVYEGSSRHERALEAVERTRGVLLAYAGGLVPGYYSSCCGGLAAVAADAISDHPFNAIPPLDGRDGPDVCRAAPLYSWTVARPHADVAARVAAWAHRRALPVLAGLGRIAAIEVETLNPHGRPVSFRITATSGESEVLGAEALRHAVNTTRPGLPVPEHSLFSSYVRVNVGPERIVFDGHGYGHGVGLCQHGAQTLALAGEDYEAILRWYYPGVEMGRGWGGGRD